MLLQIYLVLILCCPVLMPFRGNGPVIEVLPPPHEVITYPTISLENHPEWAPDAFQFGYSREIARTFFSLSSRHRDWIFGPLARIYELPQEVYQDAHWVYECWDTLDNLLGGHPLSENPSFRDKQQKRLKELLGEEAYNARVMPPWASGWNFGGLNPIGITPPSQRPNQ